MKRDPADRFATVDEMLLALCPTDHSSYLAPPTSLTMIGERAAKNRSNQKQASLISRAQQPDASLTDTFLPTAELVDTKENKPSFSDVAKDAWNESQGFSWLTSFFNSSDTKEKKPGSDSLPFSRPGVSLPALGWLSVPGLYWRPTGKQLASSDTTPMAWRVITALIASAALVGLAVISTPIAEQDILIMPLIVVAMAAAISWTLRQFLPRSPELLWTIASRILAGILICFGGLILRMLVDEFANLPNSRYLSTDDLAFYLMPMAFVIDWRCFISADRYPRVGLIRTATAVGLFVFPFLQDSWQPEHIILPAILTAAALISIQLLAPQHRVLTTQKRASKKTGPTPESNSASVDPALANTQADQPEIDVIKETV